MAEKRMFSKKIIDTDWFMDMPASTQNLYFHLSMRADDDGFIANPRRIVRLVGASEDDYKLLIAKAFIIVFDNGICVIKDWRINNYLRGDRYTETIYKEEKAQLTLCENGEYKLGIPECIPLVATDNISNSNTDSIFNNKIKHKYGEYKNVLLTDEQYNKLKEKFPNDYEERIKNLDEGIEQKGYKYKNHLLTIIKWAEKECKQRGKLPYATANEQYLKENKERLARIDETPF